MAKSKKTSKFKPAAKVSEPNPLPLPKQPVKASAPEPKPDPPMNKMIEYRVAPGKSLTSKLGMLNAGELLSPGTFPGGLENLERLVDKGYVVKS